MSDDKFVINGLDPRTSVLKPVVGDWVEMGETGKRYKILEIRGNDARVETPMGMRWCNLDHRVEVKTTLPTFEDALRESEARELMRNGNTSAFKNERLPLTYDTVKGLGTGHRGVIDSLKTKAAEMKRHEQQAMRKKKYERGNTRDDNKLYTEDVKYVGAQLRSGIRLEKPQGSSLHHFMDYNEDIELDFFKREWQSFIIEHDWAKAFEKVDGFNDAGDVVLPYDNVVFEFRISGLRVLIFIVSKADGGMEGLVCTGVNMRWYVNAERFVFKGGRIFGLSDMNEIIQPGQEGYALADEFLGLLNRQVRAVCIMLDSDVAEADERPASPALNKHRAKAGKTPVRSYNVVRLHRKHTVRSECTTPTGRKVRCHYRRGHWRHYELPSSGAEQIVDKDGILRSRTWINWMLVGDIDLGFVDKEYRL